jgi:poly-beta-hydroxybutyrate-responsive repressor
MHIEILEESDMSEGKESREGPRGGAEARPKNWLVPVILLSLREWNSYGYELMERATAFGFGAMNPGTLYRTLRQMEKDGIVESSWETSKGGPARRMYSITDAGVDYLDFWARSLEQYQRTMDSFFRLYTGRPLREEDPEPGKGTSGKSGKKEEDEAS